MGDVARNYGCDYVIEKKKNIEGSGKPNYPHIGGVHRLRGNCIL